MNDVASLRAEIKTWERTFKAKQGREPTVDDIKKLPDIAQKYKLYKKLSKAVANPPPTQQSTSLQSPSTPTRSSKARSDKSALVALTSRVVAPTAPLSSFNPFSPQKKKGKEPERPEPRIPQPLFNPFASPTKSRPKPQSADGLESPVFGTVPSARPASPPAPSSAISRARKRLRGEPVSPSPSKEKRRRTGSQTTLNFPRLAFKQNGKFPSHEATQEESDDEHESSFVDDSPMKPAGRAFTLLFDEAKPTGADIFGLKNSSSNKTVKGKADSNDPFPEIEPVQPLEPLHGKISSASSQSNTRRSSPSALSSPPPDASGASRPQSSRSSVEVEAGDKETTIEPTRRSRSPLLPPSPPPATATSKGPGKRKADSRAFVNRKKMKVAKGGNTDDEDASDDSGLKTKVKIVDRAQLKRSRAEDDVDPEFDPILDLPRETHDSNTLLDPEHESHAIDVNLPEKFKEVLDLKTTHWKGQPVAENKLVDSLLYGRRTTTYDSKKGEIWDVGEDEDVDEDKREDADEEWEGEPVPWEVAEF